jgi:hypothetical protein
MPVEVLESKVAEGLAKNVAMARIATAIERRAQAMERAHAALSQAAAKAGSRPFRTWPSAPTPSRPG